MTLDRATTEGASTTIPVLIVGAGPTGLVLALWLTKLGIPVRIIDKTAEPGTTSRALAVAARTLELYRQIGLADTIIQLGVQVPGANFWVQGNPVARLPLGEIGHDLTPFPRPLIFPQDVHERVLVAQLEALGVHVERQTTLVGFQAQQDAVIAEIQRADGTREQCATRYLAGCDGARSAVREGLGVGFPGGTYSDIFYVADIVGSGPPTNGEIHVDLGRSEFLAIFPLQGPGRVRLVGSVPPDAQERHAQLTFEDVHDRAVTHLGLKVDHVNWFSTYHVHHRVAARFHVGRAFLLGDAAHIHSPVGGQGMNTGIGDAVNLAWKLAAVLKGEATDRLLESYEPERIAFAHRLVSTTDRAFTLVTDRGPIAWRFRTRIVPRIARVLFRFDAVRRFLFQTVSQTRLTYREASFNEGQAGAVHGGDRLPWVEITPGEDNFTPLTSLAWQVHVYGQPHPGVAEACAQLQLPLHEFSWTPNMQRAGLAPQALYLIRPDGYVALADPAGKPERLRAYIQSRELAPRGN